MLKFLSHARRKAARDERGNANIEFILIFPLLAFWLIFSFIFWDAFRSFSRTEKVAFAVSDIVSRYEQIDETDMDYLVALVEKMLPSQLDQRVTRISSICYEDATYKVMWSHVVSGDDVEGYSYHTDDTVPTDIMPPMAAQDSIILTEVIGRWSPPATFGGLGPYTWENALVTRPRFVQFIPHETLNADTICPKWIDENEDD